MDLSSLTPVSTESIRQNLKNAHVGMRIYCIKETIRRAIRMYEEYSKGRFWFSKKKPLEGWLREDVSSFGYKIPRFRDIAMGNDYEGFIHSTLANCEFSSNGTVYMTDDSMGIYRHVLYCIENKEVLEEIRKSREANPNLWKFYEENWRVRK